MVADTRRSISSTIDKDQGLFVFVYRCLQLRKRRMCQAGHQLLALEVDDVDLRFLRLAGTIRQRLSMIFAGLDIMKALQ